MRRRCISPLMAAYSVAAWATGCGGSSASPAMDGSSDHPPLDGSLASERGSSVDAESSDVMAADPDAGGDMSSPAETGSIGPPSDGGGDAARDGGLSALSVQGNQIVDEQGKPVLLHGVDRPSLEWSKTGVSLSQADIDLMAQVWHAKVVRIPLNQDFWLSGAALYSAGYAALVDTVVTWAREAGAYAILDLHWSDRGNLQVTGTANGANGQQLMADVNSITFWQEVASKYKNAPNVLFELYNEPHDISWDVWRDGGTASSGGVMFTAAGMQQLYDAVRGTGANNIVLAGGLAFASNLSGIQSHVLSGSNVVYNVHVYRGANATPPSGGWAPGWDNNFGFLTNNYPVMSTEFGTTDCSADFVSQLIAYYDSHRMGWTSWAWFVSGCPFPSIISDWNGSPAPGMGQTVQQALLGY